MATRIDSAMQYIPERAREAMEFEGLRGGLISDAVRPLNAVLLERAETIALLRGELQTHKYAIKGHCPMWVNAFDNVCFARYEPS